MTADSPNAEEHGPIRVRDRSTASDGRGMTVAIDHQIPGTTLGRWVFHAPTDAPWSTPNPHLHDYPHDFVCIRGRCLLAYGPGDAEPRRTLLMAGDVCHVRASVAHQLLLDPGAVVASYIPHDTWLRRPDVVELTHLEWVPCV